METVPESLKHIKQMRNYPEHHQATLALSAKMEIQSTETETEFSFKDIGLSHCPNLQDYYLFIMSQIFYTRFTVFKQMAYEGVNFARQDQAPLAIWVSFKRQQNIKNTSALGKMLSCSLAERGTEG